MKSMPTLVERANWNGFMTFSISFDFCYILATSLRWKLPVTMPLSLPTTNCRAVILPTASHVSNGLRIVYQERRLALLHNQTRSSSS